MRRYSYGEPSGRKIGQIGVYMMYPETLVREEPESQRALPKSDIAFNFTYGPSTGGLMESTQFNILTTGESIRGMSSDPFFKTRYLEVIGKNVEEALPLVERVNGPFTASHSLAFLGAVEDALEVEVDRSVMLGRIAELELERMRNHLHVVARICEAAAFGVPYNSLFYLREEVNRIILKYTGHRFFHGVNNINAINADFYGLSKSLENVINEVKDVYNSLTDSKIFVDRLLDNGAVHDPECLGPVARGCGYSHDARLDSDSLDYSELNFSPVVETHGNGDTMDRFMVRFEEIFQSTEIIKDVEKLMDNQPVQLHHDQKDGVGVGRVESPSGDIAYLLDIENRRINKIDMLTSSRVNLPVFLESTRGNVFTDFHFNWESFGIWISEIGVEFI